MEEMSERPGSVRQQEKMPTLFGLPGCLKGKALEPRKGVPVTVQLLGFSILMICRNSYRTTDFADSSKLLSLLAKPLPITTPSIYLLEL